VTGAVVKLTPEQQGGWRHCWGWVLLDAAIWFAAISGATWLRFDFKNTSVLAATTLAIAAAARVVHLLVGVVIGPHAVSHRRRPPRTNATKAALGIDCVRMLSNHKHIGNVAPKPDPTAPPLAKPAALPLTDAGLAHSGDRAAEVPPLFGRKSVLLGVLTSGFVIANAAQPSASAATPVYVPKWAPSTTYTFGQQVISPNNDVVSAKVAHKSSAVYATDTAKWTLSATYASKATEITVTSGRLSDPSLAAAYAQRWQPLTTYTAGQAVLSPIGDVVTAITGFTSGASYVATDWILSPALAASRVTALIAPQPARFFDKDLRMVTTFQAGHGYASVAGGVLTDDTTDYVLGTQSIKLDTLNANGACTATKTGLAPIDFTGRTPVLAFKTSDIEHIFAISLYLGADEAFTNRWSWSNEVGYLSRDAGRWVNRGEWSWITFPWETPTGTPDRAAITAIQVRITANADGPLAVNVNGIGHYKMPSAYPNGVVSFSFDDNNISIKTNALPCLTNSGYPATAFCIVENMLADDPRWWNVADGHAMEAVGWEMAHHSYSQAVHSAGFTGVSAAVLLDDIQKGRQFFLSEGFRSPEHMAWPYGVYDAATLAMCRKFFISGRGAYATPQIETVIPADPMRLRILNIQSTDTVASITAQIDEAYANGRWLHLVFHHIVASPGFGQYSITGFQQIVNYCTTKAIPVKTIGEVMRTNGLGT